MADTVFIWKEIRRLIANPRSKLMVMATKGKLDLKLSNPSEAIDFAVTMSTKLAPAWTSSDLTQKYTLQKMLFPEGIHYNRQNHTYRTTRVNSVFEVIACVSKELGQKKSGQRKKNFQLSASVAGTGLEPMTFGL